jgi:periplasmic divalent cation tolerance protein
MTGMIVVLTAMPNRRSAQKLADRLVQEKLAACVSVVPGMISTYRWKGKIERAREAFVWIKTSKSHWKSVQKFVLKHHPYELPEVVALPVSLGTKKYLAWLEANLSGL